MKFKATEALSGLLLQSRKKTHFSMILARIFSIYLEEPSQHPLKLEPSLRLFIPQDQEMLSFKWLKGWGKQPKIQVIQ